MEPFGVLTKEIDFTLIILYTFWLFFAALLFYLFRENRREGFPLVDDVTGKREKGGLIWIPSPKKFITSTGDVHLAPNRADVEPEINAVPAAPFPGAPLVPVGNPLTAGVGAGSWAIRADRPDLNAENEIKIVPMRLLPEHSVAEEDADPRGMEVIAADGLPVGTITDLWIDRSEALVRYVEIKLDPEVMGASSAPAPSEAAPTADAGPAGNGDVSDTADEGNGASEGDEQSDDGDVVVAVKPATTAVNSAAVDTVLMPMNSASLSPLYGQVMTPTLLAHQFADVPRIKDPSLVTLMEEEKIMAYFAAGEFYATPGRAEPLR
ncbi:MAG: photosynthetic reaction center subunit H [Pseudomonadota bacterium]